MREQENKPNNPQVFPIVVDRHDISFGLTLRDYFAGQVMQGMISSPDLRELFATKGNVTNTDWMDVMAENCFYVVDAILKQREL